MRTIIIISKCTKIRGPRKAVEAHYEFHFKGVYAGEMINKIVVQWNSKQQIELDEEYLLYVHVISCMKGTLKGEILRIKSLDDCWDRS